MAYGRVRTAELARWLVTQVHPQQTVLDIGCGTRWYWPALEDKGVTLHGVDQCTQWGADCVMDFEHTPLPFGENSFDVVFMLDVIEHLDRDAGQLLLEQAEYIARDKVILLTPGVWDENRAALTDDEHMGNLHNIHKCLWTAADFQGWKREEQLKFIRNSRKRRNYFLGTMEVGA